jgi:hypothetical protein
MNTNEPVVWDSLNAKLLKDFIATPTGASALAATLYQLPPFNDATPHTLMVSTLLREGYQRAVQALLDLQTFQPPQPEPEERYQDLDKNELWPAELQLPPDEDKPTT